MDKFILLTLSVAILLGCAKESDVAADKSSFSRVYDNNQFAASYSPIDVKQTPDGGYLVLGSRRLADSYFSGIYLLKLDAFGAVVSEKEVESDKVAPIAPILQINDRYFFFCMDAASLQTQLIELDANGEITKITEVGVSYPAACSNDNGTFLLLSYDHVNKQTIASTVSSSGNLLKSKGYTIGVGDGIEEPITNHFIRTGRQFPFQIGRTTNGLYFFNGFYNYNFSLVFTDLSADDPVGIVQGQRDDGGISAIAVLEGNKYAAARFNFGDNYFLPSLSINPQQISSSADLIGNTLLELTNNAVVKLIQTTIASRSVILYGSNSRSKQIVIYGYEQASSRFLGSRYLGFSNPFEIAAMTTTRDGGLAICGTTYVAGRFPRICLFKLSAQDLSKSFK